MLTTVIVMCIAISEAFVHQLSGFKLQPMVHPRHRGAAKLCRQAWRQQAGYASKATAVSIQAHVAGRPEDETKRSKLFRARKLLDESRMAFESWRSARPKTDLKISTASGLNETESPDLVSEFRIRSQWSRTGRALYGTWLKVFGGEAGTTFLSDPLGLQYASEGEDWIRAAFERIDLDRSGTIDNTELSAIIKEMTGLPANETTVRKLLSEATLQSQPQAGSESAVVMSQSDFAGPMRALLDQRRALGLASEIARAGKKDRELVVHSLEAARQDGILIGGAHNATARLNNLSACGVLRLWNSGHVAKENVSTQRICMELGLKNGPDRALGLRPSFITHFRYTGVRWLGLAAFLSLLVSSCLSSVYWQLAHLAAVFGLVASSLYLVCLIAFTFAPNLVDLLYN